MSRIAILVAMCLVGCTTGRAQVPPLAPPSHDALSDAADSPRRSAPRVEVHMPDGWTSVNLASVSPGTFLSSSNAEYSGSMLLSQGPATAPAAAEAEDIASELSKAGFTCSPVLTDMQLVSASFTVAKASVRGKIVVRHFGPTPTLRLVVMGNWPDDADAECARAVDRVVSEARVTTEVSP